MTKQPKKKGLPGTEKPLSIYNLSAGDAQDSLEYAYRNQIEGIADELCTIGEQEYNFGRYLQRKRGRRRVLVKRLRCLSEEYVAFVRRDHGRK